MSASSSVSAAAGDETESREDREIGDSELGRNAWERPIAAMRGSRLAGHFMVAPRGNQNEQTNEHTCNKTMERERGLSFVGLKVETGAFIAKKQAQDVMHDE